MTHDSHQQIIIDLGRARAEAARLSLCGDVAGSQAWRWCALKLWQSLQR